MAFTHGKDAVFWLDSTVPTLTNISAYVDSVEGLPGEVELSDVSALGDEGHKNIPGLENASISVSGHWDSTLDALFGAPSAWKTATRTIEFGPAGGGGGSVKYTAECWITNYAVSAAVADKVSWSATLQVDGQVTRTTF
jgi:hypothetical protein